VNAAFLLMTSAMLVGQTGGGTDKKPAPPPVATTPAPAVSSGCGAGCGGCQDACGCESFGSRLRDRLRGLFNRNSCCDTCNTCAPTCHTHVARSCDSCDSCAPRAWTWQRRCHEPACNTCTSTCNTCNDSCGCGSHAFLDRLREGFRRNSCCDTCNTCNSCGAAPTTVAPPAKGGEPIAPPKKMPEPPKNGDKKPAQVRIDNAPGQIPAIPTVPTVEVTPAPSAVPVPRVEGERPF
jgi:hypothetical protein